LQAGGSRRIVDPRIPSNHCEIGALAWAVKFLWVNFDVLPSNRIADVWQAESESEGPMVVRTMQLDILRRTHGVCYRRCVPACG
jgi:hypothetical protein